MYNGIVSFNTNFWTGSVAIFEQQKQGLACETIGVYPALSALSPHKHLPTAPEDH